MTEFEEAYLKSCIERGVTKLLDLAGDMANDVPSQELAFWQAIHAHAQKEIDEYRTSGNSYTLFQKAKV